MQVGDGLAREGVVMDQGGTPAEPEAPVATGAAMGSVQPLVISGPQKAVADVLTSYHEEQRKEQLKYARGTNELVTRKVNEL